MSDCFVAMQRHLGNSVVRPDSHIGGLACRAVRGLVPWRTAWLPGTSSDQECGHVGWSVLASASARRASPSRSPVGPDRRREKWRLGYTPVPYGAPALTARSALLPRTVLIVRSSPSDRSISRVRSLSTPPAVAWSRKWSCSGSRAELQFDIFTARHADQINRRFVQFPDTRLYESAQLQRIVVEH